MTNEVEVVMTAVVGDLVLEKVVYGQCLVRVGWVWGEAMVVVGRCVSCAETGRDLLGGGAQVRMNKRQDSAALAVEFSPP